MDLDWNRRVRIEDQTVIVHTRNSDRPPKVTIGLPTFNRAHTIHRALASLACQTFRDFVVIISDNAGVSESTVNAVRQVENDLPEVYLVAQPSNIGALANLNFLLGCASTEYFMWLADDDEISDNYLEELVSLLEDDPDAVSAMGRWHMMRNEHEGNDLRQLDNSSRSRTVRVFKYIAFEADDSFFYGLHRADQLRRCRFKDYFYPNAGTLTNWCYVFLFDLLLQGRIRYTRNATWMCHNDSQKSYARASAGGVLNKMKTLVRRLNVYLLYCWKTAQRSPLMLFVSIPASLIGLARDIVSALSRAVLRRSARNEIA